MSAICARLGSKERQEFKRRKENRRLSFLLPRRGARHAPRRPQAVNPPLRFSEKLPRPLGANPPAAVRVPRSAGAEKGAARQGEHA